MQLLESAIRRGIESEQGSIINTFYASAKFEANKEVLENFGKEKIKSIHFEASVESKIYGPSTFSRNVAKHNERYNSEIMKNTYNSSSQKTSKAAKPEYVYWIKNELDKW